jgi:hypothetical protein
MTCIYLDSPQGSDQWHKDRCGAATGSKFLDCRGRYKSGKNAGQPLKAAQDYAFKLAYERITGELLEDPEFTPWQARRGNELEPEARLHYESIKGVLVEQAGLALTEDRLFGASVDGLVDDDGQIEIKCFLSPPKLSAILLTGDIGECMDQVQGGLWITGRKWCDFVLYCPALVKIGKDLTIIRVVRDDEYIAELEKDLLEFNCLVNEYETKLRSK